MHKWLNNEATPEEVEQLLTDPEYAQLIEIARVSSEFDIPEMDMSANFEAISNKKTRFKQEKTTVFSTVWKVAAVAVLLLAGYFYFTTLTTSVETGIAQTNSFTLPDASEVTLNADSKITYNKNKWKQNRFLSLEGEAFFKVSKGNTFKVKTSEGSVTVLGTQFNVFVRNGLFEVACYEGIVQVNFKDKHLKLSAGEKLHIEDGKWNSNLVADNSIPSWLNKESRFEDTTVQLVFKELERQYPVHVSLENIDLTKRFTGTFTHENLELALQSICEPLQLNYKINDKKINITAQ